MKKQNQVKRIDLSRKRIAHIADKYYNEGNFLAALKFAHREWENYGGDPDVFARLADIYEGMNLHGMALNCWFRYLHIACDEDIADVYEGLAVNYLTMGMETQAAFYYNRLIDTDDSIPEETKLDIVEAFASQKKEELRFVYPPRLADYSKEMRIGAKALKAGDCRQALAEFAKVEKGSKQYVQAKEMESVAHLLNGDPDEAEKTCLELLSIEPKDVRALATLAAVYLEQGRKEESRTIAEELASIQVDDEEELFKIATVCCENELHQEAYEKLKLLDKKTPYDGKILYFKGVAAYKSGRLQEAIDAFEVLITIYPDAEVARYYRNALVAYQNGGEAPELLYFYHLPQKERESRCQILMQINECNKDEAQLFGLLALHDRYFEWCFDEMDGNDRELQYLGIITAVHVHADGFVQNLLLDYEVADVLKLETLRLLLERNEGNEFGLVLCHIYRRIFLPRITIGRKRNKKFVQAFAKVTSKFIIIKDSYGERLKTAAEQLYAGLASYNSLDLVDSVNDCACAIFLMSGIKELGNNPQQIANAFEANVAKVQVLLSAAISYEYSIGKGREEE